MTVFGALSEPIRIRMLQMMAQKGIDGELPCTTLDEELPIAKSTISYHVQILRRAGLIQMRKVGRNYFYRLQRDAFEVFAPGFLENLEEADSDLLAA